MFVFCSALFLSPSHTHTLPSNLTRCKSVNATSSRYHFSSTFTDITTFLSFIYFDRCCLHLHLSISCHIKIVHISFTYYASQSNFAICFLSLSLSHFLLFSQCLLLCKLFDGLKGFTGIPGQSIKC